MGVKRWGDAAERVETEDGILIKTHEELTVMSWDELASHDCSMYLQGSIALNIPEHKLAIWDGESDWYDEDGETHAGGGGGGLYFIRFNNNTTSTMELVDGERYTVTHGNEYTIYATNKPSLDDPSTVSYPIESITSSDPEKIDVFITPQQNGGIASRMATGTATITITAQGTTISITCDISR